MRERVFTYFIFVADALKKMAPVCKSYISSDGELRQKLKFLQTQYQSLSEKEQAEAGNTEEKYFSSILSTLSDINHSISLHKSEL